MAAAAPVLTLVPPHKHAVAAEHQTVAVVHLNALASAVDPMLAAAPAPITAPPPKPVVAVGLRTSVVVLPTAPGNAGVLTAVAGLV